MKKLITTTFAIMLLAGGIGTFVPHGSAQFGSQDYWTQEANEYS